MEFFRKWFGRSSSDEIAPGQAVTERYSARVEALRKTEACDEYQDHTSFSWNAREPLSSSIFDAPARRIALVEDPQDDQDAGYDPYDTGRFV